MIKLEKDIREEQMLDQDGKTCQVCGSKETSDIFVAKQIPVHVGMFYDTHEAALNTPKGDIVLTHCHHCMFTFNRCFDASKLFYSPGYEVALHHSTVFRDYISQLVNRLTDRFDLHKKTILEIGCGDGWFLKQLCQAGSNNGIGVDPTTPFEGLQTCDFGTLGLIREYYGSQHAGISADFMCCLSALEHIPDPKRFLQIVKTNLKGQDAGLYFEVFNAFQAFNRQETWSPHYEQCNYFSLESLSTAFDLAGFEVQQAGTDYQGDQYLYVEAINSGSHCDTRNDFSSTGFGKSISAEIQQFTRSHHQNISYWSNKLTQWQEKNQNVVFWGAAGKGISFLNTLPSEGVIERVVDINPEKQGKYLPGTGQHIISPQELSLNHPDVIIISNALYRGEITKQVGAMGIDCEILTA